MSVPVLLLTGYLGAGKTTLLNLILANQQGIRFAVIVNDLGEVNIDADLIQKGGVVGSQGADDLVALQNGCICCTLQTDLIKQIAGLAASGNFDYIVIEASGICEPEPIAQTICSFPQLDPAVTLGAKPVLDAIVTVVDALRLADEFACGDNLNRKNISDDDIENLIIQQIEFCNIIILNKISEISPEQAEHVRAVIRAIQPKARIIEADFCNVPLPEIINTHLFDFEKVATSAAWVQHIEAAPTQEQEEHARHHHHEHLHHDDDHDEHHHDHSQCDHEHGICHCHHHHDHEHGHADEFGIQTFVYYRREGFDINRFDRLMATAWPKNIIRCKGVLYFNHNRDMSFLFETAGKQKRLTQAGLWFATAPADELAEFMRTQPGLARDWDPVYGDRMVKLVIIGQNLDRHAIITALDNC